MPDGTTLPLPLTANGIGGMATDPYLGKLCWLKVAKSIYCSDLTGLNTRLEFEAEREQTVSGFALDTDIHFIYVVLRNWNPGKNPFTVRVVSLFDSGSSLSFAEKLKKTS